MGSNVYMFWIIIAIFGPLFHTLVNILDNYFVNRIFKHTATLIFYSYLVNLLFLPLIFVFKMPQIPTLTMIHFFIILTLINIAYLYSYYKALQDDDTSVVTSLFDVGKLFV